MAVPRCPSLTPLVFLLMLVVAPSHAAGGGAPGCLPQLVSLCSPARAVGGEPGCLVCCGKNQHSLRTVGCTQTNFHQFCAQPYAQLQMSIAVTVSPMGSAKSPVHASPIALGGTVLYSTLEPDCAFYRINASTGDMLWRYAAPRPATTDPSGTRCGLRACARVSTDGRHIHIGTDNNTFIMLSADRGEMVWVKEEPYAVCIDKARPVAEQNRPCEVYSTALLVGSLRIQGSEDGFVRAFREATGDLEWSVAVGAGCGGSDDLCHQVNGSPVLNPTNASEIIIGADDGFLHCLVVASGEDCGRLATCGGMDTLPSVDAATGRLFYTCFHANVDKPADHPGGWVGSVDMHTFQHLWTLGDIGGIPLFTPVHPAVVFVGYMNGSIGALSATTSERIWMTNSGGGEFFGSLIFDPRRDLLFGAHVKGLLIAVDPYVGRVVATLNLGRTVAAELGPALSSDEGALLWVGTYSGKLLGVNLTAPPLRL